jgi:hypothetical protein
VALVVSTLFGSAGALGLLFGFAVMVNEGFDDDYFPGLFAAFLLFAFFGGQLFVLTRADAREAFDAEAASQAEHGAG